MPATPLPLPLSLPSSTLLWHYWDHVAAHPAMWFRSETGAQLVALYTHMLERQAGVEAAREFVRLCRAAGYTAADGKALDCLYPVEYR